MREPLARAPVESPAVLDDIVHGVHGLFNGCARVRTVTEDHVHVVQLHALDRGLGAVNDVLAAESLVRAFLDAAEDLGREHEIFSFPDAVLDTALHDLAHERLRLPLGVHLGVVEEVDAVLVGQRHDVVGLVNTEAVGEIDPAAQR